MRILADMGVSMQVVAWLRAEGHEALHLSEEGLQRLPNGEIFAKAAREDRVVLTVDLDFSEIAASAGPHSPGVILLRLRNTRSEFVIKRLTVILHAIRGESVRGTVIVVQDARWRVRRWPTNPNE